MNDPIEAERRTAGRLRTSLIVACTILLAFIFGAGWQFMRAQGLERELDRMRTDLTFSRLEADLGAGIALSAGGRRRQTRPLQLRPIY